VRLSEQKDGMSLPKPPSSTGNAGERSGESALNEVEWGPAVGPSSIKYKWKRRSTLCHPGGRTTQGWRGEKKLNLIRTINPELKDLAQTWGWKMIPVHKKIYS
jgi:hypothetical protein